MTNTNHILFLQAVLQGLQVVNVGLATMHVPAALPLIIAAVIASISNYVQHMGNQATPPEAKP